MLFYLSPTVLWVSLRTGARSQTASILSRLAEVKEVQDKLRDREKMLADTEMELGALRATAEK